MAVLLLAFLKNRGFGKKGVSNFTKSFSVLSFFFFKGLKAPLLPCEDEERGGSCPGPPAPHLHTGSDSRTGADIMGSKATG